MIRRPLSSIAIAAAALAIGSPGALGLLGCNEPAPGAAASPERVASVAVPASVRPLELHGPFTGTARPARAYRPGADRVRPSPRAAARRSGDGPLALSFEVDESMGARDPMIAAGRSHLVVTTATRIAFYGKDGTPLSMLRAGELFAPVRDDINTNCKLGEAARQHPVNEFYDVRVIHDEHRDRFWIGALVRNPTTRNRADRDKTFRRSKFALAVSRTGDPTGEWLFYWWDAVIDDGACNQPDAAPNSFTCPGTEFKPGCVADYPNIGISRGLFVEANFSTTSEIINVARADDLANGTVNQGRSSAFHLWNFKNPDGSPVPNVLHPAVHHGAMQGDLAFLTSTNPKSTLVVWGVGLGPNDAAPVLMSQAVAVEPFNMPSPAPQPPVAGMPRPPLLDIGLVRGQVMRAAYRDGSLWATWHDCKRWPGAERCATSIRVARVDVRGFPGAIPTTLDHTFGMRDADDAAGVISSYGWPVIEVNRRGDAVLGFNRSGASVYPEARFGLIRAGEREARGFPLRAGEFPLGDGDRDEYDEDDKAVGRIDNSGISVDPEDDTSIWVIQPFSVRDRESRGVWRLAVGKVTP